MFIYTTSLQLAPQILYWDFSFKFVVFFPCFFPLDASFLILNSDICAGQPEMQLAFSHSPNSTAYTYESEGSHQPQISLPQAFNPMMRNSFTMKEFFPIPYNGENGWSQGFLPTSIVPGSHLTNDDISDTQMPNWSLVNTAWDLGNGFGNESQHNIPFPNIKTRASWCKIRAAIKWWLIGRDIEAAKMARAFYIDY